MYVDGLNLTESVTIYGVNDSVCLEVRGDLADNQDSASWSAPDNIQITGVHCSLSEAATGSDVILVLKKNGTSICEQNIVIGAGTDYVFIDNTELLEDNGVEDDLFQVELLDVGSTTPGKNLCVQLNYFTVGRDESTLATDLNAEFFPAIAFTKAYSGNDLVNSNGHTIENYGYSEDRKDLEAQPTPTSGTYGSASGQVIDGFKLKILSAYHNKTTGERFLQTMYAGGDIPQKFVDKIYIDSLGEFTFEDSTGIGNKQAQNMTSIAWQLTDDQYEKFKENNSDSFRIKYNAELETTDTLLIPAAYVKSSNGKAFNGFIGFDDYSVTDNIKGLLLNPGNIIALNVYEYSTSNGTINQNTDVLQLWLSGNVSEAEEFGAIRVGDFGVFASSSASVIRRQYHSNSGNTYWRWNIEREQPFKDGKVGNDLGQSVITIDSEKAAYNRSVTMAQFTDGAGDVWKTYQNNNAYQASRGSISSRNWQGQNIIEAWGVIDQRGSGNQQIGFLMRFDGQYDTTLFSWIDVEGFGRFYIEDADIWNNTTHDYTQYFWHISEQKFNEWPNSSPHIMFQIKL